MMSAEDMALAKIAIELCHNPELKGEILCAPGSKYDNNHSRGEYLRLQMWKAFVKDIATRLVRSLGLSKHLQERVLEVLLLIAKGMLNWAVYHEDILGLSCEQSMNALNSSLFTQQGRVDNKKAAMELMKQEDFSIGQRYKVACLYCFTDHILDLYDQMTEGEKEGFYDGQIMQIIQQPELISFWSYFLAGQIDQLRGEKSTSQYMLESAVQSGSRAGVEWCLENANTELSDSSISDAAIETLRSVSNSTVDEEFVFDLDRYGENNAWTPNNYFIDILCLLLSKMTYAQQIDFFRKDIDESQSSSVLRYFLNWPYQNYFMKTANLMWEFLPERSFSYVLYRISDIFSREIKYYDYNKVFRDFWCNSPEHFKRYMFKNETIGKFFLSLIFSETNNLTNENSENIFLVLADARNEEKEYIFSSYEGTEVCSRLLRARRWKVLDKFILNCIPSKEQADIFKRDLSNRERVMRIFLDFVKNDDWNAVHSFLMWSCLNEEEINELKKNAFYSPSGREACTHLILHYENIKPAEKIIRWCFSLEANIKAYKKELAFSYEGINNCACLIIKYNLELANKYVNWSLCSEEDIRELKRVIACTEGPDICEQIISNIEIDYIYHRATGVLDRVLEFEEGRWEQVEMFLTWAFSSERDITDFKKGVLLEKSATNILSYLIRLNQWEEADVFFAWIGLSPEGIKQLKKETIFNHLDTFDMFLTMVYTKYWQHNYEYGYIFQDYGSKQEGIGLFLRWFLTDKETVLEFKDKFTNVNIANINMRTRDIEEQTAALNYFNLAIEQRLSDLNLEHRGVKRNFCNADL